ncbi:MAG: YidC/Oxa1 family membrane protein insertase [Candidatus Dormibacteraeota bacterium]|nr:YidC/Oxa1 family membrane protein insertase [Candidatus Dormibacteraeota bacterium]
MIAASSNPFAFLKPIGDLIGLLKIPFTFVLGHLYDLFRVVPPLRLIGAYGLSIIFLTVIIKLCLFPLYQKQLKMSKKTQEEQRRVAPELSALRKKHKGDPAKLNTETMALYKEHGINPLGGLAGCLPTLAQLPILIGLYQSIYNFHGHIVPNFLWIHDLTKPAHYNDPITWVLPAIAGATTFIQSKMMAPPPAPSGDDSQAAQMAQMSSTMSLIMPAVIVYFAFNPNIGQGLVLYWIVSNLFSIGQQYFVNGWGQLPILGSKPAVPAVATSGNGNGRGRTGAGAGVKGAADITVTGNGNNGNGSTTDGNAGNGARRKQTAGGKRRRR